MEIRFWSPQRDVGIVKMSPTLPSRAIEALSRCSSSSAKQPDQNHQGVHGVTLAKLASVTEFSTSSNKDMRNVLQR